VDPPPPVVPASPVVPPFPALVEPPEPVWPADPALPAEPVLPFPPAPEGCFIPSLAVQDTKIPKVRTIQVRVMAHQNTTNPRCDSDYSDARQQ
jgi:hypothetical protein